MRITEDEIACADVFRPQETVGVVAYIVDGDGVRLGGCQVLVEIRNGASEVVASLQGFSESDGTAIMT